MESSFDIGVVGLGVMGENIAINLINNDFKVSLFDTDTVRVKRVSERYSDSAFPANSLSEFCSSLSLPRKILVIVPAGEPVTNVIEHISPYLENGDILVDLGNSHFEDTNNRTSELSRKGILFVGAGMSGGAEGALKGPSIMPGGAKAAWSHIKTPLEKISAKVSDGSVCCDWIGGGGSGHFVKMVHNGIEYGDMQIICEAYHILKELLQCSNDEISEIFKTWNNGLLNSYLIEITSKIFKKADNNGDFVIDTILDVAGQKGTGKWTAISALEHGIPVTLIAEAVLARYLSAHKSERIKANELFNNKITNKKIEIDSSTKKELISKLEKALYASKIVSYAQGFSLLKSASNFYTWDIDLAAVSQLWRGGCIIRSDFLRFITEAFRNNPELENLLLSDYFSEQVSLSDSAWREIVSLGISYAVPLPSMSSALSYFDGYRCKSLPANLLQAQRDFFGSHKYEKISHPRGEFFHTDW